MFKTSLPAQQRFFCGKLVKSHNANGQLNNHPNKQTKKKRRTKRNKKRHECFKNKKNKKEKKKKNPDCSLFLKSGRSNSEILSKKNTVKEMGNKLKWLVHLCAQIYDALMRCCWQILLVKPSSRNKQGLSQSLSYSGSPVLQEENLFFRPTDPG